MAEARLNKMSQALDILVYTHTHRAQTHTQTLIRSHHPSLFEIQSLMEKGQDVKHTKERTIKMQIQFHGIARKNSKVNDSLGYRYMQ